jgi:hypothetical protein
MTTEARVTGLVTFDYILATLNKSAAWFYSLISSKDEEEEQTTDDTNDTTSVPVDEEQKPPDLGVSVSDSSETKEAFGP